MAKGKRKLGTKSEMPDVFGGGPVLNAKQVVSAAEAWALSIDLSVEACAARQAARPKPKTNGFRDKATKAFEQKLASAIQARAWKSVEHAFNQYGTYLELVN